MAILSTAEYKALAGITDTSQDTRIDAFLPLVDAAIRDYTERSFDTAETVETRDYKWDGRGAVEIDDVQQVTAVTLDGVAQTEGTQYVLGPDREPRYYWLELPAQRPRSTEMGFTWNADMYGTIFPRVFPVTVSVTGKFGYQASDVPGGVKLAAFLALSSVLTAGPDGAGGSLSSESIDTYSRSWDTGSNLQAQGYPVDFLPSRATTLLDPFVRRTGRA